MFGRDNAVIAKKRGQSSVTHHSEFVLSFYISGQVKQSSNVTQELCNIKSLSWSVVTARLDNRKPCYPRLSHLSAICAQVYSEVYGVVRDKVISTKINLFLELCNVHTSDVVLIWGLPR